MILGPSWANNFDMRSTMGYIKFTNGNPIHLRSNVDKSKIQKTTCEIRYIALSKMITDTIAIENAIHPGKK
jgi:hypothetical protein